MSDRTGFLDHVFKGVTPDVIQKERQRMIKEGKIQTLETEFGSLEVMKHPGLSDNEIRFSGQTIIIDNEEQD